MHVHAGAAQLEPRGAGILAAHVDRADVAGLLHRRFELGPRDAEPFEGGVHVSEERSLEAAAEAVVEARGGQADVRRRRARHRR